MTIRFDRMKDWRESRIAALLFIAVFVAIQLSIPISRLSEESPRRFGWQMLSVAREAPTFVAHTNLGDNEIELVDFVARARGDIDLEEVLPTHLCRVLSDANSVSWENGQLEC
jgi:hypothetical protein